MLKKLLSAKPLWIIVGLLLLSGAIGYYLTIRRPGLRVKPRPLRFKPLRFDSGRVPKTIRVLRTRLPYHPTFCMDRYRGRCIQKLSLERYVRGVVLAEEGVFRNHALTDGRLDPRKLERVKQAWKLQAIAARTYAVYCILADKYKFRTTGFHITDTPRDQAYKDGLRQGIRDAVSETRGQLLVDRRGRLIYAEYSASCHSRGTRSVLNRYQRIRCHSGCKHYGFKGSSHYRGMCQWGSLLFALDGRRLRWLTRHYYPNARLLKSRRSLLGQRTPASPSSR